MAREKSECYYCGRWDDIEVHHVFGGVANRRMSEKYGLKVDLCPACHRKAHSWQGEEMRQELHEEFQDKFEREHSRKEFIELFGRSYL